LAYANLEIDVMASFARERKAKVFRNGRNRAVRIPREFDFEADEVTIRQENDGRLTIEPCRPRRTPRQLVEWLRSQPPLEDGDLPTIDDSDMLPLDDVEL
jgi:antitoxin VapB